MTEKYFDFLRYSLQPDAVPYASVAEMDWQGLYRFGKEQALLGVLYEGIKRLPQGAFTDVDLLAKWTVVAQKIAQKNQVINTIASEIQSILKQDNVRSCILKGQGNALLYQNPLCRNPGDIDIWIVGKTKKEIMEYCKSRFDVPDGVHFHHVEFKYKGIAIEMHFIPGIENNPFYNHRLQVWYKRIADLQCSNYVNLPDNAGQIAIPTIEFNLVYQLAHLYHHFFDEGVGLRQIVDYYLLIKNYDLRIKEGAGESVNSSPLIVNLRSLGLLKFAGAVMWVLGEVLHLSDEEMIVAPDENRGKVLLDEILNGGNFGKYDTKYGGLTMQSTGKKYFTKVRRSFTFASLYPSEAISEPIFRTYHFFWRIRSNR